MECLEGLGIISHVGQMKNLLKDIRFWITFFFIIRLIGITNPPLEVAHNWRQTTVTMVARNFLECNNNIFYPRIDIAGEKTGITGMEFPLLNYLIYLTAELFGYQHWYGRLINLIVSSLGLLFFYKLTRKYFTEQISLYSTIILSVSIWFQFSRKVMPDTFSMSFILASLYYGSNYLETNESRKRLWYLMAYSLLLTLGALSKLPSAYLMIVLVIYFQNKEIHVKRKIISFIVTLTSMLPVLIWYFFWVPYLVNTYEFTHFFMGKNMVVGFLEIVQNIPETLTRFYDVALKYIGFILFLYGLVYSLIRKEKSLLSVFFLSFAGFSFIIFSGGFTFYHHSYYIIPFVPVMALVAGYGLSKITNTKIAILLLFAVALEGIGNQQHDFRIREREIFLANLEKDLDKVSDSKDLILINSGDYPTPMYFAHRKGWVNVNDKIQDDNYLLELKDKGLKYILILKKSFGTEIKLKGLQVMLNNENYCLYKL